jgi:hypothetical protein
MKPGESGDLGTDNRGEQGLERVRLPRLERLDLSRIITIITLHAYVSITFDTPFAQPKTIQSCLCNN